MVNKKEESARRRPGRPRKGEERPRSIDMDAAAEHARKFRENKKASGYVALNTWVPASMREDLLEMVQAEVERRLAMETRPRLGGAGEL